MVSSACKKKLLTHLERNLRPCLLRGDGIDDLDIGGLERFERLLSYHCAGVGVFQIVDRKPTALHPQF